MFSRFAKRFKAGWAFGTEAINLVKQHPKLLVFPVLSGLAFAAIVAQIWLVGVATIPTVMKKFFEYAQANPELLDSESESYPTLIFDKFWQMHMGFALGWLFFNYVLLWTVSIFLNTALCGTLLNFHTTRQMSLRTGLSLAFKRLPQIIGWALFASTIGVILAWVTSILEEYLSWFGTVLGTLVELAWGVSIYFVAPVLAAEGVGPFGAVKRSAAMIKKQWGQMVGSEISVFWRLWPLHLFGAACLAMLVAMPLPELKLAAGCGLVVYFIVSSALNSLMSGIVCTNLYRFAATGTTPTGANHAAYETAFRSKK
jgi:Family of unknown function (DUF6159)